MAEPDRNTRDFYSSGDVAKDYDAVRFESPGGRATDALQKSLVARAIDAIDLRGKRALDIACGTGRFTKMLVERGAEVTGLDVSNAMIEQAKEKCQGAEFVQGDARRLDYADKSFELALSVNGFNHLESHCDAIAELCRVARVSVLGLPNKHSLLFLHLVWRMLNRMPRGYGGYTVRKYDGLPIPYSIYFRATELESVMRAAGKARVEFSTNIFLPVIPSVAAGIVTKLDPLFERLAPRRGTFMVIMGRDEVGD